MKDFQLSGGTGVNWVAFAAPTTFKDIPRQKFRKEVVRVGKFVKDSEGREFDFGADVLTNWVTQFQRMRKNGVKVPICSTHDGANDPDAMRGYVEDLFIEGDTLIMACELIGEDSIKAAARNDVSLGSHAEFVDGHGNTYTRPIMHIALCPDPVVPGLGEFVPLAASLNAKSRKEVDVMDYRKIQEAFGIDKEMTKESAESILLSHAKTVDELAQTCIKVKADLKALMDKKKEGDTKLSRDVDPVTVGLLADNRKLKLEALVLAAKITPAVRDELAKDWADKEAVTLELSRDGAGIDVFDRFLNAIAKNDPVKLKEQTGPQANAELSRNTNDSKKNPLVADAEKRAKEAKDAGMVC